MFGQLELHRKNLKDLKESSQTGFSYSDVVWLKCAPPVLKRGEGSNQDDIPFNNFEISSHKIGGGNILITGIV